MLISFLCNMPSPPNTWVPSIYKPHSQRIRELIGNYPIKAPSGNKDAEEMPKEVSIFSCEICHEGVFDLDYERGKKIMLIHIEESHKDLNYKPKIHEGKIPWSTYCFLFRGYISRKELILSPVFVRNIPSWFLGQK